MFFERKLKLFLIFGLSIVLLGLVGIYFIQSKNNRGHSERMQIDAIIGTFLPLRSVAEKAISEGATVAPDVLHRKWLGLNSGYNISNAVFGENGEVIFVSDALQRVIVIKPVFGAGGPSWHCSVFPAVSYKTLCSDFPIKFGT